MAAPINGFNGIILERINEREGKVIVRIGAYRYELQVLKEGQRVTNFDQSYVKQEIEKLCAAILTKPEWQDMHGAEKIDIGFKDRDFQNLTYTVAGSPNNKSMEKIHLNEIPVSSLSDLIDSVEERTHTTALQIIQDIGRSLYQGPPSTGETPYSEEPPSISTEPPVVHSYTGPLSDVGTRHEISKRLAVADPYNQEAFEKQFEGQDLQALSVAALTVLQKAQQADQTEYDQIMDSFGHEARKEREALEEVLKAPAEELATKGGDRWWHRSLVLNALGHYLYHVQTDQHLDQDTIRQVCDHINITIP